MLSANLRVSTGFHVVVDAHDNPVALRRQGDSRDYLLDSPGTSPFASAVHAYRHGLRSRPPLILGVGDSNFTGEGAGVGGGTVPKLTDAARRGPFDQIVDTLPSLSGLTPIRASFFGDSNVTALGCPIAEYDPRLSIGSGWTIDAGSTYIGGRFFQAAAGAAGFLEFNTGLQGADTVEVHFPTKLSGAFSADCGIYASDGTKIGTFATLTGQTDSVGVVTVTSPKLADGIVRIKNDDGAGAARLGGVIVYKANAPHFMLVRGSNSGATIDTISSTASAIAGLGQIDTIRPDLTILAPTINDIIANTAPATFNTKLTAAATKAMRYGSVIIATGQPGGSANYLNGVWLDIETECKKVAAALGCGFVSMHKELVSYATQQALNNTWDQHHMKSGGYRIQAGALARAIKAALTA